MKPTNDRLAVARAVRDEMRNPVFYNGRPRPQSIEKIIESLPEPPDDSPATLPVDPLQSFDASVWAREFKRVAISLGYSDMDEGWLLVWFANAIMRGFDEHARQQEQPEPLPAPTGPGFYWARQLWNDSAKWAVVEVFEHEVRCEFGDYPELRVWVTGVEGDSVVEDYDAWLPLVAPTAKGGAE